MKNNNIRASCFLFMFAIVIFLAGCGSDETVMYERSTPAGTDTLVLEADGDEIQHATIESTQPYDVLGIESQEEAEERLGSSLDAMVEEVEDTEGIEITFSTEEDMVQLEAELDFTTLDPDDLEALNLGFNPLNEENLSLEQVRNDLESDGFEEVE